MLADLFWDIATSTPALGIVALVLAAALVAGYFPLLRLFPLIGPCVPAARLLSLILTAALFLLVGFRIADERAEAAALRARLEAKAIDLEAAEDAAKKADAARAALADQAKADQERIADYERALAEKPDRSCILTDDDLRWLRSNNKRSR